MGAVMSLIARDISVFDQRAIYSLGANNQIRLSGGMASLVLNSDKIIVFNTLSTSVAGWTLEKWGKEWDTEAEFDEMFEQSEKSRSLTGLNRRLPFHFHCKFFEDGPVGHCDGIREEVLTKYDKYDVIVFHQLKTRQQYIAELVDGVLEEMPEQCPSSFEHECSITYAEYLESKIYESITVAFAQWSDSLDSFIDWLTNASKGNFINDELLISQWNLRDYAIYLLSEDGEVIGRFSDNEEHVIVEEMYGISPAELFEVESNFKDFFTSEASVIRLGDEYNSQGFSSEDFVETIHDYGVLPISAERWLDVDIQYADLTTKSVKQHSKTFILGDHRLEMLMMLHRPLKNIKCSDGCPEFSVCGNDGLFCVCDLDSVLTDRSDFDCAPKYILQGPPSARNIVYISTAVAFVFGMMTSILLCFNRKTKLMRLSSHTITQVVILGVMILFGASVSFAVPVIETGTVCWLRPVLTVSGLSIALLALFLKTWRIQKLVNNLKMKKMKLSNMVLFKFMSIVLVPIGIVLAVWIFIFDPSVEYYSEDALDYENPQYAVCSESIEVATVILVMLVAIITWGGYNASRSKAAPVGANESGAIMNTLFIFLTCGVIIIPLNFMVSDDNQDLMTIIRGLGVLLCACAVLISIVGNKVVWLIQGLGNADFVHQLSSTRHSTGIKRYGTHTTRGSTVSRSTIGNSQTRSVITSMHSRVNRLGGGNERAVLSMISNSTSTRSGGIPSTFGIGMSSMDDSAHSDCNSMASSIVSHTLVKKIKVKAVGI
eukprot:TRINITY_DN1238_c0_g4_i2.p1 TRINITY_DN1238_c0_g4~~TRINITY_DN1238_c0_g4_i2.p1  ORF type:complete len:895 (+),score=200.26 TRINITY_DN1238_c0_g4_i2:375-2687(+)